MSDWYRTAFGAEYLALYAHRSEEEAQQAIALILRETGIAAGARVLDAPCGAGRHARAFANAGMRIIGLDLSQPLLHAAMHDEQHRALHRPDYVRADLRSLPFRSNSFHLVTNLFTSIGYFEAESENAQVVIELARVCQSSGHVVIDFMNSPQVKSNFRESSERVLLSGTRIADRRWITQNPERVNKHTIATSAAGEQKEFMESVRLYSRADLEGMMNSAGLLPVDLFGDYTGNPWTEMSPRIVLIGRKQ